jgi:proteasome assembly chaperone (PAC2) family protein
VSANPHGYVGHSGLHDIYPADDRAELMTGGELVSRENGRSVSQIVASSRIRQIAKESGNLEIYLVSGKSTGRVENEFVVLRAMKHQRQ